MSGRTISLRFRLLAIPALAALGLFAFAVVTVLTVRNGQLETRRVQIHSVVEAAMKVAEAYHGKAKKGEMTEEAAKAAALDAIGMIRFDGDNYLWVNDLEGNLLMHPFRPKVRRQIHLPRLRRRRAGGRRPGGLRRPPSRRGFL
jgi:methyl-accepting chemotaxis protein